MAKYDSLRENLARRTSGEVTMTFRDIEQFVGDLPASSQTDQWWRATDSVQAQAWRTVGWRVSSVSQTREIVVFARNGTAADLAEAASELGRAFRYLSRHAFFSLGVLHPVNQVIAVISSILQQLRDYAATDKIEFTIRLFRMWPYRRVRLTFSSDILTLTFPSLPPFIRDQVKLSTKLDPKFKLSRMLPGLALGLFIGRLLAGLVQTILQLPYRAFLAAVRCWSGGLRASLGSAAALFALFFVVFTTGDAWRIVVPKPAHRASGRPFARA